MPDKVSYVVVSMTPRVISAMMEGRRVYRSKVKTWEVT
jgi:hypothetical protein